MTTFDHCHFRNIYLILLPLIHLLSSNTLLASSAPPRDPEVAALEKIISEYLESNDLRAAQSVLRGTVENTSESEIVRIRAIELLTKLDSEAAKEYLASLIKTVLSPYEQRGVRHNAELAFMKIRISELSSGREQEELLRSIIQKDSKIDVQLIRRWAENELCERGAVVALPEIEASLRRDYSSRDRFEDEFELCRRKSLAMAAHGSLVDELKHILSMEDSTRYGQLRTWAIMKLEEIGTPAADRLLAEKALDYYQQDFETNYDAICKIIKILSERRNWKRKEFRAVGFLDMPRCWAW